MDPSLVTDESVPINVISGTGEMTVGMIGLDNYLRNVSAEREQNHIEAIAEQRKKLNQASTSTFILSADDISRAGIKNMSPK